MTRLIPSLVILVLTLGCSASNQRIPTADAPPWRTSVTSAEHTKLVDFFRGSYTGKDVAFPLSLKRSQVFVFSHTTGIHDILWQGGDSLLLFEIEVPKAGGTTIYRFKFTIKPKLPSLSEVEPVEWKGVLSRSRVTQYKICEILANRIDTVEMKK